VVVERCREAVRIGRCQDPELDRTVLLLPVKDEKGAALALQLQNAPKLGAGAFGVAQVQRAAVLPIGPQVALCQERNASEPAGEAVGVKAAGHASLGCRVRNHSVPPLEADLTDPLHPHEDAGCSSPP